MRWRYKPWRRQQLDEARIWFAWHPVVIGEQWVWLEYVSRTLTGWVNDMNGSEPAYEYADVSPEQRGHR